MFDFVLDQDACVRRDPFPGVRMYVTEAEKMTLSIVEMDPHAVIPDHQHPNEQIGYMVEGQIEFIIGGRSHRVVPGQIWRIPSNVPHKVIAGDQPIRSVDVFYPIREDMRGRG